MKIPKQIVLVIVVMLVGKACGYSEESIMSLVKFILFLINDFLKQIFIH